MQNDEMKQLYRRLNDMAGLAAEESRKLSIANKLIADLVRVGRICAFCCDRNDEGGCDRMENGEKCEATLVNYMRIRRVLMGEEVVEAAYDLEHECWRFPEEGGRHDGH